ncbi:MAG TPA: adenylate kinase [Clostridiales bacterium]|jgi:adenylate kinase|nr:adenylate kinase [Clostridiales bacterium]
MRIILLGAPGAGKGTQAVKISTKYNIPHISTGDILRANIKQGTEIGKKAKSYIDQGALVPDEVVIEIVKNRLNEEDCKNGYLLDGFPRTVAQAQALDEFAKIDIALNIDIDLDILTKRLSGRRVCSVCGAPYHISSYNDTKCAKCGGEVIQRQDDQPQTVKARLKTYTLQTKPLIDYYADMQLLVNIDGNRAIDDVFEDIVKILN